ncbi:hypothetical protein DX03_19980 [Stenotrophomonas rhizophila]|nr:hypothetical protein DX03_19980 [Stenotrophomonas rhizophila]
MNIAVVIFIGYRIGRRFKKMICTAESIFSMLGWPDVKWVNLRKEVAARRQSGDPPQLGDTYSDNYVVEADVNGAPEPASPLPGSGA